MWIGRIIYAGGRKSSDEFQIRIDERQSEFRGGEKLLPFNGISQLSTSGPSSFRPSFPRDRRKRRPSSPIPKPLNERRRRPRIFLPSFLPSSSPLRAFHGSVKHRRESISQFSRPPTVPWLVRMRERIERNGYPISYPGYLFWLIFF